MKISQISAIIGLIIPLAGAGWWASETLAGKADKEDVRIVAAKADTALDTQIEYLIAKVTRLEQKKYKSRYDIEEIKYLRGQIERLRKLRAQ